MTTAAMMNGKAVDPAKLEAFQQKMLDDLGGAMSTVIGFMGDKLGLYEKLSANGGLTSIELAERTGLCERNVREWLNGQAAAGWIEYDPGREMFSMTSEQAAVLAQEGHPAFLQGFIDFIYSCFKDEEKLRETFRSGRGLSWGDHHECLYCSADRFFRPLYEASLVQEWIPALDGVKEKLERGAKVADVGCGHGSSLIIMAQAFPNSQFFGFDIHEPSIEVAQAQAKEAGVDRRTTFQVCPAKEFPGDDYDFIAFFDCLHDMGDPVGAAKHVHSTLAPDGTWMVVEPFANDELVDNLNPVGQLYYSASTMACVPSSQAQEVGLALGAQAGEKRLTNVLKEGGFTRIRRAHASPFNLVLEARP